LLKTLWSTRWFHPLLLLVWIVIGAGLRFTQLTGKPPWTDEFATLVFSLGNSYHTVPLDQAISLDTLLEPLLPNPGVGASTVMHNLFREDHHPPLYFVLAHWWMQLFPASGGYVSLWAARSLPALFGVASIPAVYGLGWLAFRRTRSCLAALTPLVAQLAAAMMAVSPYGVFLTQEARHYALAILWVIASLCCLVVAMQHLKHRTPLPIWIALCWVVVNALGMATHYFFSLTLCAEAIVLIGVWLVNSGFRMNRKSQKVRSEQLEAGDECSKDIPVGSDSRRYAGWWRIYAVAVGTLVGCLVWVPTWQLSHDSQMTQWIMNGNRTILSLIGPIFQSLAAWITMLTLLPVESSTLLVVIASGAVMLLFFIWAVPIVYRSLKALRRQPETRLGTSILGGFVLGAIALFFAITYFLGIDLTRGARYNFVYFPAVIVLLGAALAISWNAPLEGGEDRSSYDSGARRSPKQMGRGENSLRFRTSGKLAVALIWLMGLLGGITVVSNLGYQKYYRPDLLVPVIQKASSAPILIATTHNTLVQTGEMMGLAWEFKRVAPSRKSPLKIQFLLAHQQQEQCDGTAEPDSQGTVCRASTTLQDAIAQLPRPLDLWLVNFKAPVVPEPPNCFAEDISQYQTSVHGYTARLYHCLADNSQASRS
jgi:uncharacterized membrane protein